MVVITSGVKDMQAVLNLVWDKLLPAFQVGLRCPPMTRRASRSYTGRLRGLTLRPQDGSATPAKVSEQDLRVPVEPEEAGGDLRSRATTRATPSSPASTARTRRISCGRGEWKKGRIAFGPLPEQPAAASGGWTGDDTFAAKICFYETPFQVKLTLKFSGDEVRLESESNVGFGPTRQAPLVGKAE